MTRRDHLAALVLLAAWVALSLGQTGWPRAIVGLAALTTILHWLPEALDRHHDDPDDDLSPWADALHHLEDHRGAR